jgi:dTDP-4-amino-4,6-dideoxygalactose transaminase
MSEQAIKTPLPKGAMGISVVEDREIEAVTKLLKNPTKLFRHLGSEESNCDAFERELREKTGAKHALMVSSGTAALSCCLSALQIGPGDEVIVPGYTFIATASAVVNVGAVPVIAEIDNSLGLDPDDVERKITPYTKAFIAVHMQGVPCRLDALRAVARKHNLLMIEDCCQAIGAQYKGKYCGLEADAWAWSLNFYKVITSGEGGVFFANDDRVFQRGLFQSDPAIPMWDTTLKNTASIPPYSRAGYRGNELAAAVARVQLTKLDGLLAKSRSLKKLLISSLNSPKNYMLQHVDDPEGDCGISFAIIGNSTEQTRKLSEELKAEGLNMGSIYNGGFPDRHVYSNWDSIINKNSPTPAGYPWKDPSYLGNVQYSKDMCPNTLDLLERSMRFSLNINMTETNMLEVADAINKADSRV